MSTLTATLQELSRDVDHLLATYVVDIDSGMPLAGITKDPTLDAIAAAASYANVVKANANALRFLGMDAQATEDIVITTQTFYVLIRMLGTGHYHSVMMGKQASLGLTRSLMSKYAARLQEAIPR